VVFEGCFGVFLGGVFGLCVVFVKLLLYMNELGGLVSAL